MPVQSLSEQERLRSLAGAAASCRIRSYLSSLRKQGRLTLDALVSVFLGTPVPPIPAE